MTSEPMDSTSLWQFMGNKMEELKFRGPQIFLPKSAFDRATTREIIAQIVAEDEDMYLSAEEEAEFVTKVHHEARKLFATCVFADMPMTCLKALLANGWTDKDFPLSIAQCPGQRFKKRFVSAFLVNQRRFHTPFLDPYSILSLDDSFSMPVDFNECPSTNLLGRGAFGEVWRVRIHEDHRAFSSGVSEFGEFAMKVIQNERSIQRERKFIQAMAGLNHSHLVKCLAGWTYDSKFYMIYELASCNLEEFMQDRMESHQPRGIAESMFVKQLCGLAAALRVIHCQGEDSEISKDTYLGVPRSDNKKTGYIHDLKPENILVFMSSETVQSFRISDFSCAKVVDFVASVSGKRRSHLTTSKSGTPIYRAPESMGGATSRPYDLWSLGCVYLELLVWFFDGYRALEVFRNERVELVHPHGAEDEGFYSMIDEGPDAKMRLRKPVLNKIEELSARSGGSLKEIVNIIPDLLKIAPEERLTATALVKKLRELNTGADLTFPSPSTTALLAPAPMTLPAPAEESDIEPNGFVVVEDYS